MTGAGETSTGELVALLTCYGAKIDSVALVLQRPLQLLRSLHGQPAQACLQLLPRLFPLCGYAHALAACDAAETVCGVHVGPEHHAARATIALADAVAAHVWRGAIDWQLLLNRPANAERTVQAGQLVASIAAGLYPRGDWCAVGGGRLAPNPAQLTTARGQLRALRATLDLERALAALRAGLSSALIGADPEWPARLQPCFLEMAGAAMNSFAILDARLQAVAALPQGGPADHQLEGIAAASGRGCGQAHTARGIVECDLTLDDGCVVDCQLQTPADRAFTPAGTAASLLGRLHRAENPAAAVRWILAAFDPGASVRVEVVREGLA